MEGFGAAAHKIDLDTFSYSSEIARSDPSFPIHGSLRATYCQ